MAGAVKRFLANKVNRLILFVILALVVALAVIVPVVDVEYLKKRSATDSVKQKAIDASRYAMINTSFPDPSMIVVNDTYYAFATRRKVNNVTIHVQVASAVDITKWTLHEHHDAMPTLPPWALTGRDAQVWAPQVAQRVITSSIRRSHS